MREGADGWNLSQRCLLLFLFLFHYPGSLLGAFFGGLFATTTCIADDPVMVSLWTEAYSLELNLSSS